MLSTKVKWIKTIAIYCCVFLTSFLLRSFYSTLLDFTEILQSSVEIVSFGLSVRCIGGCVGSLLAGVLFQYVDRLTVCAVFLMLGGISAATLPNVTILIYFYTFKAIIGVTGGVVRSGIVTSLAEIWQKQSRPFIQANAFMQIMSGFVTPLIIHPFLSEDMKNIKNIKQTAAEHHYNDSHAFDFSHNITSDMKSEIWIPYASLGVAMNTAACVVLFLQLWVAKTSKSWSLEDKEEENKTVEEKKSSTMYRWCVIGICCLTIVLVSAMMLSFCQFWTTFVVFSDLEISKAKGNLMLSAFAIAMGCGSLFTIFLAIKIKPLQMLTILVSTMLIGNFIILCFGHESELLLWVGGSLVSAGLGCCTATVITCLSERTPVTNVVGALTSFATNIAHACGLTVLIGHYIQEFPNVLIYMNIALLSVIIVFMFLLKLLDSMKDKLFKNPIQI